MQSADSASQPVDSASQQANPATQPTDSTSPPAYSASQTAESSSQTADSATQTADSAPQPADSAPRPADSAPQPLCKPKNNYQCKECGEVLSSRNTLYKHKKRKHKDTQQVNQSKQKTNNGDVICPDCKVAETT